MFTLLYLFLYPALAAAVDEPRCYWPNGDLDTTGYVCNITAATTGGASACCLHNDACYESGSCFQDWSGVTYRQSCTDSSWKDSSCPQMCLGKGQTGMSVWIQQCNVSTGTACCLGDDPCCDNSDNFFQWKPGYITAVINGDGSNRLGPYVAADANSSSSSSSSSAVAEATSTSSSNDVRTSSSALSAPSPSSSSGSSRGNTVATAVGVVFGVLSLIAFTGMLVFWRKYKAERRLRMAAEEKAQGQLGGQEYYYQQPQPTVYPTELSATENTRNELPGK